ncbi:MAG: glutamate formimidoyltransferase [Tannerellaceae bacterium]|jgi:glutamate formiminotransferase|nr:glutamate formimidoyltransferase [Tannerellaceae bacterium]
MTQYHHIIESVPNFSEGRNQETVEEIVNVFRAKEGVKLLNYSCDPDHNRMVATIVGEPAALKAVIIESAGKAIERIDLNLHRGEHPRIGAVDVIPFIPIKGCTMEDAVSLSKEVGSELASIYKLPVLLYEKSASAPHRENLANVRKGEFEGLDAKFLLPEWKPDYGEPIKHPTAGATAVGARKPLIAYNVILGTDRLDIAESIAKRVRHSSGGLRCCKAMGVEMKQKGLVQVSMNLTDYSLTSVYQAFEMVKMEANRFGTPVMGSELIGLMPLEALVDVAAYYLGLENFSVNNVLEYKLN